MCLDYNSYWMEEHFWSEESFVTDVDRVGLFGWIG